MSDYNSIQISRDLWRETVESVPRNWMRREFQGKRPRCGDLRHGALLSLVGIAAAVLPALCQAQTYPGYFITTISENGSYSHLGSGGVAVDTAGNLYVVDTFNQLIRKVSNGVITIIAGNGTAGFGGDNGPATSAELDFPVDLAVDSAGNVYISDTYSYRIRKVSNGVITTVAGNGTSGFSGDNGPATSAQLRQCKGVAVDSAASLYIADWINGRVRKVSNGVITTVAGNGTQGFSGDNGPATSAELLPFGVAVDAAGNLYIADQDHNVIRKVSSGVVTTVAGNGTSGFSGDGGPATSAQLAYPSGVAVDSAGNLYIADLSNQRIRRVSKGVITTVAGNGTSGFSGDGGPATSAQLAGPQNIAVSPAGNVYFTDQFDVIRVLTLAEIPCAYSVSPTTWQAPASGGNLTVSIQTTASCTWAISGLPSWITASSPSGAGSIAIPLTVAANSAAARTATISIAGVSVQVTQASGVPVPTISPGGVVNAASYGGLVAPGGLATVFGTFLLNSTTAASGTPWPSTLSGLSMQFAGKYLAPLYVVSAGQATVQVPWEVTGQTQATTLTVTSSGQTSSPQTASVVPFAPAIFTMNQQGTGQGAILDSSTARLVDSSSPAVAGSSFVSIYCTGLGAVLNQPATGAAASSHTLSGTTTIPVVTIGGVRATVGYSGLAPGAVGLYQVNAQVPAGSSVGNAVPVVISIGGATSNFVTMAVKATSETGNLQIQITGLPGGTPANVAITSAAGFSNIVTSNQNLQVPTGNYTITAASVPVGSVYYAAFPVQQSVTVTAGSSTTVQVSYNAVIPQTVQTLDPQGAQSLSVSPDGNTLTMSANSQAAKSLVPGSVLAIGVTPATPYGLLRQVTSVSQSGSQLVAQTTQATLTDVFQEADFTFSTTITPQNSRARSLLPGVLFRSGTPPGLAPQAATPQDASQLQCASSAPFVLDIPDTPIVQDGNGTLAMSGQIQICPSFVFDFRISGFSLKSLTATATLAENIHLNLGANYHAAFDKQVPVATVATDPIVVFVGPVPIVLTPTFTVYVGVSGQADGGFSVGVTQSASATGGLSYANGALTKVATSTNSFTTDPFAITANVSAKAYAGITMDLNIEGVLAPEFSPEAYLQLDADLTKNPWWTLSAGAEGDAKVKVTIFGHDLKDFDEPGVFAFSKIIAQASGGYSPSSVAPILAGISPSTAPAGSAGLTLTLNGYNFIPGATAYFGGTPLSTTFVNPQQLTAVLPASSLSTAGTFAVAVTNPGTPGASSLYLSFVVQGTTPQNPQPTVSLVSPSSATAGTSSLLVTLTGTGFLNSSMVTFNGVTHSATYVSGGQINLTLNSTDLGTAGSYAIVVTNPPPGGGSSQPATFTVQPAAVTPTLQSLTLSPTTVLGGGSVTGTVTLSAAAAAGGVQVLLSSSNPIAQAPAFVNVSGGQSSATFTITTTLVASNQSVVISASFAGVTKTANLAVNAATVTATLQNFTLSPTSVVGGGSVTGTITLTAGAPVGGVQVLVSSSNYPIAQIPAFVSVPSGETSTTFTITTTIVSSSQSVTISASIGGVTKTATLAVNAATVTATVIYAGTGGGIYRSSDGGVTWQQSLAWPEVSFKFPYGIAIDPLNYSNVYVAAVDYSIPGSVLHRSTDAGQTWTTVSAPDAGPLAIDAVSTNVIYLRSQLGAGLYRSTDKGATWNPTALARVYGVTADPTLSGVVYASALTPDSFLLYKSTDFGATWALLATNLNLPASNPGMTTSITVDPHNSNTLYASGQGLCVPGSTASMCGLFKSTDGGHNWQNLGVQGDYSYSSVAIDHTTGVLYAGGTLAPYFGYVVKSPDAGRTWTPINTGLTTESAVVFADPGNSSNLFVLGQSSSGQSANGLFRSTNGGASWAFTQIVPVGGGVLSFGIPPK